MSNLNCKVIVGALSLSLSINALAASAAADSFLCIGDQATGFAQSQRNGRWNVQNFHPRKYVIRTPIVGPTEPSGAAKAVLMVYEVGKVGKGEFVAFCNSTFNEIGLLGCEGMGESFWFSHKTMRFIHWLPFGYLDAPDGFFAGATPFMEIGTCSGI
jgi:hypothetical protein